LVIGGLFAYFHTEQRLFFIVAPYREMAAHLVIIGVVLFVLGYVSNQRAEEEGKKEREDKTKEEFQKKEFKFCIHCGEKIPKESEFCPKCGKKQS